ncbi:hypothetical protein FRC10_007880 [Ceratobasidium sp. 414]|nr:hypothetical protein FRC10_007880 [Ceratobasidium sp. 414]
MSPMAHSMVRKDATDVDVGDADIVTGRAAKEAEVEEEYRGEWLAALGLYSPIAHGTGSYTAESIQKIVCAQREPGSGPAESEEETLMWRTIKSAVETPDGSNTLSSPVAAAHTDAASGSGDVPPQDAKQGTLPLMAVMAIRLLRQ